MCARAVPAGLASRRLDLRRCDSGVAAIEFAIVGPLLIMLLVGIFSVGSVLHSLSSVRYALGETARVLQLNPKLSQSELQVRLDEELKEYGKGSVMLTMTIEKDASGSDVARLKATYPYLIAVPFIPKYEGAYKQSVEIFLTIAR